MDKLQKALRAMSAREQKACLLLFKQIKSDYRKIPGIKAVKGLARGYRVRMGNYRIIFRIDSEGKTEILRLARRNEKTYQDL